MPRVPTYQPQVSARPLQGSINVNVPNNAFGNAAGLLVAGEQLGRASTDMHRMALEEKANNDKRTAKEVYLKAKNAVRVEMYGTGQNGQPQGQLTLQGDAAKNVVENSRKILEKARKDAEKGLTNDTQRDLFATFFDGDEQSTLDKAFAHQNKQMTELDIKTATSLIDDATQDLINSDTEEDFQRAKQALEAHSRELARLQGLPEEARANLVEKQISSAHTNRVSSLLAAEDFAAARVYMDKNQDAILPEQRVGLEAKIKDGEQTRQAFDIGMRVFNSMPGASLKDKIAEARKQSGNDFDVEKGAVNWVKSLHSEQERAMGEYRTNVENRFRDAAQQAQTPDQLHALEVAANEITDPKARQKALEAVRVGGRAPETSNQDMVAKAEEDIAKGMTAQGLEAKYWKSLNAEDMRRLKTRIGKVDGERVNRYMLNLGQELNKAIPGKSSRRKSQRKLFTDQMNQYIDEYAATNDGRHPSAEELDKHKAFLFRERIYDADSWTPDETVPQYLMGTKELGDMPEKDAAFLTNYWRGKGLSGEALAKRVEESYRDGRYLDTDEYKAVK